MIVRSHLPWPVRWVVLSLVLGFSAALALWAFEFGKDIAGLDHHGQDELTRLNSELQQLRAERHQIQSIANTAESLLKAERTTQERLSSQIKALEAENLALRDDLGFFERLLPAGPGHGVSVRGLHAEVVSPGQLRYQLLVMQAGRSPLEFRGRFELQLVGSLDGKPWTLPADQIGDTPALQFKQYQRVGGALTFPPLAVVKGVRVRVVDGGGALRASQDVRL